MQNGGVQFINTSVITPGSTVILAKWNGGWGGLAISAAQFAPIVNLMLQLGDGTRRVQMNSTNIAANAWIPLQLPAGTYELHVANGSSIGMFASLQPTP